MWAGMLCHQGLAGVGRHEDWATHGLEHELSALNPAITHGAGLAVMFPAWMEYVHGENPARFAFYGQAVFGLTPTGDVEADALSAIDETRAFFASLGHAHHPRRVGCGRGRHPEDAADACPEQGRPLRHLQEADPGRRRGHLQAGAGRGRGSEAECSSSSSPLSSFSCK